MRKFMVAAHQIVTKRADVIIEALDYDDAREKFWDKAYSGQVNWHEKVTESVVDANAID